MEKEKIKHKHSSDSNNNNNKVVNPFKTLKQASEALKIKKDPNAITKVSQARLDSINKLIERAVSKNEEEFQFTLRPDDDDNNYKDAIISYLGKARWKLQERKSGQPHTTYVFKNSPHTSKD